MKAEMIKVQHFEFENIIECHGRKAFGEHGYLIIKGVIKEGKQSEYLDKAQLYDKLKVTVTDHDGNEENLLHGILYDVRFRHENGVPVMVIHLKTASYLTDLDKHIRSFQKEGIGCDQAAKICLAKYPGGKHIIGKMKEKPEGGLLLQYEETDWDFLGRLASRSNAVLLPDDELGEPKLFFGIPGDKGKFELASTTHTIKKDMTVPYKQLLGVPLQGDDTIIYEVEDRELFKVGAKGTFLDKPLYIQALDILWQGRELVLNYTLRTERAIAAARRYNKEVAGVSLQGVVAAVDKAAVAIDIDKEVDENSAEAGNILFPYATVYSTADGTGWYFMPEVGDGVRLCFPTVEEAEAYVESSVHLEDNDTRSKPDEKSLMNKQKKEILFTPTSLILRNNKGMSIEMLDDEGIKIVSNKDVMFKAKGAVEVKSNSGAIDMSADKSILMQQGASQLELKDKITMKGGKINMN